jgi:hypothetical protein
MRRGLIRRTGGLPGERETRPDPEKSQHETCGV